MMKHSSLFVLILLLSACGSSEKAIQTAIAQTQAAIPTATETFIPTDTQTPTWTPSPTPDLRVIDANPQSLILAKSDLPSDGSYYLPGPGWTSPNRNFEVVGVRGEEQGRIYLEETGRVDGWWVAYKRGSTTVIMPDEVYSIVVLFNTASGAQLLITKYGVCVENPDYARVETDFLIGDGTNICIYREMQPSGEYAVWMEIEFVYRNIYVDIEGYGSEDEVRLEFLEQVANVMLAKLETQPLSSSVTFKP